MKNFKMGFTLIELLIVIALLGALAVGLLAALDPFEQLKKGTDTGTRNIVSEVQGAIIRYYSIKNFMPWCTAADTCPLEPTSTNGSPVDLTTFNGAPYNTAIDQVINAGELKTGFMELAGGNTGKVFVTGTNDPPTIHVCYKPTAKSFRADLNTKYNIDGTLASTQNITCPDEANPNAQCYWCVE